MNLTPAKKLLGLFFLCILYLIPARGQTVNFDDYTPLQSSGKLPEEFSRTSSQKYRESKKTISHKERRSVRRAKDEFYLKSTFGIDDFLKSGKVLFNDPACAYVNKVFDKVLRAADIADGEVKLFVVKTNYSNAFATDQGIIFITTGLLARLENEAQLAFVLSHELVHYIKKHSLDIFVKQKAGQKDFTSQDDDNALFSSAAYSKEKETEADEEGVKIFLKTGYTPQAAVNVFDVLQRGHLPFSSDEFDVKNLEAGPFKWLKSLIVLSTRPVVINENEDDSLSTHPNTFKRKEKMASAIHGSGSDFYFPEQEFKNIRKLCRFEYCRNAMLERDYPDAIYSAFSLLKDDPENLYLKKIVAKSLYSLSAYFNQGFKQKLNLKFEGIEGPSQRSYCFFYKIHAYELSTLSTHYLWELKKQYPNDLEIKSLLDESMFWLAYLHYPTLEKTDNVLAPDTLKDFSKYSSSVGAEESSNSIAFDEKNVRIQLNNYAYNYLLDDAGFMNEYKPVFLSAKTEKGHTQQLFEKEKLEVKLTEKKKTPGVVREDYLMDYAKYDAVKAWEKKNKAKQRKKEFSGLFNNKLKHTEGEKVIFLNPIYFSIDQRKKEPLRYEASEKTLDVFIDRLKESATAAKVPFEMFSENFISTDEASLLNNMALLKEWTGERMDHGDVRIITSDQSRIDRLSEKLNSRYVCIAGNVYAIKDKDNTLAIFYSIVVPIYSWPFTIPYLLSKEVETYYFMLVLDLKTGLTTKAMFNYVQIKNKQDISLVTFYDFMQQAKLEQQYNK